MPIIFGDCLLQELLHDCDYSRTDKDYWCDGKEEFIKILSFGKEHYLILPWDQKNSQYICEQFWCQKKGWA